MDDHDDFPGFRALSFDCYGTLIDWETGILTELRPWAAGHGLEARPDELLAAFGATETAVESEHPTMRYPDVLGLVLERIGARFGIAASPDECADFGASVGRWPAFADTTDALARLQERFMLIILSNVDRASFAVSNERLGVEFDLILTAEDIGAYKPSPVNFAALIQGVATLGVSQHELLHVAESLYHDHEPAAEIGLASAWIHRRHDRSGSGATAPPKDAATAPARRYESMATFAAAAV
ncbi:haloacid dehalogenase type II [soil metagenome]